MLHVKKCGEIFIINWKYCSLATRAYRNFCKIIANSYRLRISHRTMCLDHRHYILVTPRNQNIMSVVLDLHWFWAYTFMHFKLVSQGWIHLGELNPETTQIRHVPRPKHFKHNYYTFKVRTKANENVFKHRGYWFSHGKRGGSAAPLHNWKLRINNIDDYEFDVNNDDNTNK